MQTKYYVEFSSKFISNNKPNRVSYIVKEGNKSVASFETSEEANEFIADLVTEDSIKNKR
jgi:hypothetical protein